MLALSVNTPPSPLLLIPRPTPPIPITRSRSGGIIENVFRPVTKYARVLYTHTHLRYYREHTCVNIPVVVQCGRKIIFIYSVRPAEPFLPNRKLRGRRIGWMCSQRFCYPNGSNPEKEKKTPSIRFRRTDRSYEMRYRTRCDDATGILSSRETSSA